jgi:hypothetical protein
MVVFAATDDVESVSEFTVYSLGNQRLFSESLLFTGARVAPSNRQSHDPYSECSGLPLIKKEEAVTAKGTGAGSH